MQGLSSEARREDTPLPGVRRLTAPNPSPMTANGTNTYVIGEDVVVVIDPGPNDPTHRAAIVAEIGGRAVQAVLVTHTHVDHSAGAPALAAETDAPLYAFGRHGAGRSERMTALADQKLGGGEGADTAFQPDHLLADGAVLAAEDGGWRIEALHTPGHTSDHLSFALSGAADAVFCGDLVMGWSTSLISPPDGDMGAFMRSLERLAARLDAGGDGIYLPGHGAPIEDPAARVSELYAHRRAREAQILDALSGGPSDADALVKRLYADVDPRLHGMAARNVLAHLIDLWERGIATPVDAFGATARFARA